MKLVEHNPNRLVYYERSRKPLYGIIIAGAIAALALWSGLDYLWRGKLLTGLGIVVLIGGPLAYAIYHLSQQDRALTVTFDRGKQTVTLEHRPWARSATEQHPFSQIAGARVEENDVGGTPCYGVVLELTSGEEVELATEYSTNAQIAFQNMAQQISDFITGSA
ncbi:MAG: hypothetical protein GYB65_01495 [Chloroflexi bacterium]|nr:hypothetical protein [Chloroflexota bacterium]